MSYIHHTDYDQIVHTIDHGGDEKIKEWTLRDLCWEYGNETSTPLGSGKVCFRDGNDVLKWEPSGRTKLIWECDSEEEAESMLLGLFLHDVDSNDDLMVFYMGREEAETYYAEMMANRKEA